MSPPKSGAAGCGQMQEILVAQRNLYAQCSRLLDLERRLHVAAKRRVASGRRGALRQVELERQRLGRELHTGVGQLLAAIRMQLDLAAASAPAPAPAAARALEAIGTLAATALEQVRDISRRLHPPEWQRLTLDTAMRQLCEVSGLLERFQASLDIEPLPWEPALAVKILLYRALQEALSNLVRHARATRVRVSLEFVAGRLVLTVQDNGIGFDAHARLAAPPHVGAGLGLRSIRESAQELGGVLELDSTPNGTKLVVSVVPFPVES
jgi:two-component system, NarL family, sensor kinase